MYSLPTVSGGKLQAVLEWNWVCCCNSLAASKGVVAAVGTPAGGLGAGLGYSKSELQVLKISSVISVELGPLGVVWGILLACFNIAKPQDT